MRYIRKKDGKIFDTSKKHYIIDGNKLILCNEYETLGGLKPDKNGFIYDICIIEKHTECKYIGEIVKQSDTIEGLIECGDLVRGIIKCEYANGKTNYIEKLIELKHSSVIGRLHDITELYTKQGNNYILCCFKNDKGEWQVI